MEISQEDLNLYLITICVPIYNTERWIAQCLNSLAAQDMWEKIFVILVDDGSQDNSLKIAQDFSRNYPKQTLLIYHGENKGLLAARYSAIIRITTPFAMFVDSDDSLPPYACSALYKTITVKDADIVMGRTITLDGSDITNNKTAFIDKWFQDYRETDNLRLKGNFEISGLPLWGKIYRSTILKVTVHGVSGRKFPAISTGEDNLLSTAVFMKAQKFFLKDEVVYNYRVNNESLTSNIGRRSIIDYLLVSLNIWKLAIHYRCFKLAEQGGNVLNSAEYRFFDSELCFPYELKIRNLFTAMNQIANEIGDEFRLSPIIEYENKIIKQFGISRLSEVLEISEYSFYSFEKPKKPVVSVIIPICDDSALLERCLESVLLQNESEIEIILVNCTSSEAHRQLIQGYAKSDMRIVIVKNTDKTESSSALNAGIEIAKAPWIMIIGSNDYVDRSILTTLLREAHNSSQLKLISCGAVILGEDGKVSKYSANNIIAGKLNNKNSKYQISCIAGPRIWKNEILIADSSLRSLGIKSTNAYSLLEQLILSSGDSSLIIRDRLYYYGITSESVSACINGSVYRLSPAENQTVYSFHKLSLKTKVRAIVRVLSKKLGIYRVMIYLVKILKGIMS